MGSVSVLNFDSKKVILSVDQTTATLFGYKTEELVGLSVDALFSPTYTKLLVHRVNRCPATFLIEGQARDGTPFPLCFDVREMHGLDASGGESKIYFATIKSSENLIKLRVTKHGRIVSVNDKLQSVFKRAQEELVGKAISLLIPGIDRVDLVEYGEFGSTVNIVGADSTGRLFPLCLLLGSEEVANDNETIIFNVTLEELPRDIIVHLTLDPKGNILSTSANFVHCLFGYWDSELVGKHIHTLISEEEFPLKLLSNANKVKSPPNKKARRMSRSQVVHVQHRRGKFSFEMTISPATSSASKEVYIVKLKLVVTSEERGFFLSSQDNLKTSIAVGNYILGDFLNRGAHSNVYKATNRSTGEVVVVKMVSPAGLDPSFMARQQNEYDLCKKMVHPYIVRYIECFSANDSFCTVMEFCGDGDLQVYINERGKLSEEEAKVKFQYMSEAVAYLHSQNIVHGDIKLQNFLLTKGIVKISDFNVSKQIEVDSGSQIIERSTFCGTPAYVAPELLLQSTYGAKEADVWSLGVCLYVMITGIYPFESIKQTIDGKYTFPQYVSEASREIVRFLLQKDPIKRPTISQILIHGWLVSDTAASKDGQSSSQTSATASNPTASLLPVPPTPPLFLPPSHHTTLHVSSQSSSSASSSLTSSLSQTFHPPPPRTEEHELHKAKKRELEEEIMQVVAEKPSLTTEDPAQHTATKSQLNLAIAATTTTTTTTTSTSSTTNNTEKEKNNAATTSSTTANDVEGAGSSEAMEQAAQKLSTNGTNATNDKKDTSTSSTSSTAANTTKNPEKNEEINSRKRKLDDDEA